MVLPYFGSKTISISDDSGANRNISLVAFCLAPAVCEVVSAFRSPPTDLTAVSGYIDRLQKLIADLEATGKQSSHELSEAVQHWVDDAGKQLEYYCLNDRLLATTLKKTQGEFETLAKKCRTGELNTFLCKCDGNVRHRFESYRYIM